MSTGTEGLADDAHDFDLWPLEARARALLRSQAAAVAALDDALPDLARALEGIAGRLARGGRLVYVGAGTSGRLALNDAVELEPTYGFDRALVLLAGDASRRASEEAEDDVDEALRELDAAGIGEEDAVVGVAASGRTPYTLAAVREARRRGAFTVGIANNVGATLLAEAEVGVLLASGPEVIAGSTRMAAGTAQKAVLNTISTALMPEVGGIYRNLMVGMTPVNRKLHRRAVGIVVAACGCAEDEAEAALAAAGGDIRGAIVQLETGCAPEACRAALDEHGGRVREAVKALSDA
jgi:N-acetylmuramic acid 6-phosphate etherase